VVHIFGVGWEIAAFVRVGVIFGTIFTSRAVQRVGKHLGKNSLARVCFVGKSIGYYPVFSIRYPTQRLVIAHANIEGYVVPVWFHGLYPVNILEAQLVGLA